MLTLRFKILPPLLFLLAIFLPAFSYPRDYSRETSFPTFSRNIEFILFSFRNFFNSPESLKTGKMEKFARKGKIFESHYLTGKFPNLKNFNFLVESFVRDYTRGAIFLSAGSLSKGWNQPLKFQCVLSVHFRICNIFAYINSLYPFDFTFSKWYFDNWLVPLIALRIYDIFFHPPDFTFSKRYFDNWFLYSLAFKIPNNFVWKFFHPSLF